MKLFDESLIGPMSRFLVFINDAVAIASATLEHRTGSGLNQLGEHYRAQEERRATDSLAALGIPNSGPPPQSIVIVGSCYIREQDCNTKSINVLR